MPPVRRCVFGCLTDGITLHNFPNPRRFPEQFKKWIELVGEPVEDLKPEEIFGKKKVCDLHFTIDDRNRNNRLNAIATPVPFPYQKRVKSHAKSNSVSTLNGQYLGISHCRIVESMNTSSMQLFVADAEHANVADTAGAASPREEAHFSTVPFAKNYSWQRPSEVISEDQDDDMPVTMSMYYEKETTDTQQDTTRKDELAKHVGFICNVCRKAISGFRYTCVQCSDMDLCGACEADKAHDEHYMLRVPTPKTAAEIHAVLVSIRRNLTTLEPLIEITKGQNNDTSRLSEASEVKSEIGDVEGMTVVGTEADVSAPDKEHQQEKVDVGAPRPKKAKLASMVDDAVASTSHERDDGNDGQKDKPPPEGSSKFDLKMVTIQTQLDLPDDGDHSGPDEFVIGDRSTPAANHPNINQIRIRTVARRRHRSRAPRAARAPPPRPGHAARPPRPARAPRSAPSGVPLLPPLPPLPGLSINSMGRVRLVLRLPSSVLRQHSNRRA